MAERRAFFFITGALPMKIYIHTYSYDWMEAAQAYPTLEKALEAVAKDFEINEDLDQEAGELPIEIANTVEFWQAVAEAYENGKWKASELYELDLDTFVMTPVSAL